MSIKTSRSAFINIFVLALILLFDLLAYGVFIDSILISFFVCLIFYNFYYRQFIFNLFVLIILYWLFLPRLHWLGDVSLLQSENFYKLALQLFYFAILLVLVTNNKVEKQRRTLHRGVRSCYLFLSLIFLISEYVMGRSGFNNDIDASIFNFLSFIPLALIPFLLCDIANDETKRRNFIIMLVAIFFAAFALKGSKFAAIQLVLIPAIYPYFLRNSIGFSRTIVITTYGVTVLFFTVSFGVIIRYGLNFFETIIKNFFDLASLIMDVFGRLNFLSIINSSVDHWGKHTNEVFFPILTGWIPRMLYPERLDINNGMWFGRLIGLIGSEEEVYVAASIFNDLLLGAHAIWQPFIFITIFFLLFLIKFVFSILFKSDLYFMVLVIVSFVLSLEQNFAFVIMSLLKKALIVIIFLGIPNLIFSNKKISNKGFNS